MPALIMALNLNKAIDISWFIYYSGGGGVKKYDLTITVGVKSCCTTCLKFPSPLNNNLKTRFFLAGWPIADIIRRHMGIYSHTH